MNFGWREQIETTYKKPYQPYKWIGYFVGHVSTKSFCIPGPFSTSVQHNHTAAMITFSFTRSSKIVTTITSISFITEIKL